MRSLCGNVSCYICYPSAVKSADGRPMVSPTCRRRLEVEAGRKGVMEEEYDDVTEVKAEP